MAAARASPFPVTCGRCDGGAPALAPPQRRALVVSCSKKRRSDEQFFVCERCGHELEASTTANTIAGFRACPPRLGAGDRLVSLTVVGSLSALAAATAAEAWPAGGTEIGSWLLDPAAYLAVGVALHIVACFVRDPLDKLSRLPLARPRRAGMELGRQRLRVACALQGVVSLALGIAAGLAYYCAVLV